jgi:membrane protein DedA with SNARE-associated domain
LARYPGLARQAKRVQPLLEFALLNMLSAAVWAVGISTLGYQFGNAVQWLLDDLRVVEESLLAAVCVAALAWALYRRVRWR